MPDYCSGFCFTKMSKEIIVLTLALVESILVNVRSQEQFPKSTSLFKFVVEAP